MEWLELLKIASPLAAAVWVIATMKSTQAVILRRLDKLESNIEKAHDRIDRHIVEWHKQ